VAVAAVGALCASLAVAHHAKVLDAERHHALDDLFDSLAQQMRVGAGTAV
jgi:hypothetical protein